MLTNDAPDSSTHLTRDPVLTRNVWDKSLTGVTSLIGSQWRETMRDALQRFESEAESITITSPSIKTVNRKFNRSGNLACNLSAADRLQWKQINVSSSDRSSSSFQQHDLWHACAVTALCLLLMMETIDSL